MLQIALEAMLIAPPCSNFHQKVNAQSFLCPARNIATHTEPAELPAKLPYLTVRVPWLPIAPPYCANSNRKVRKEKKVVKSRAGSSSMLREWRSPLTHCNEINVRGSSAGAVRTWCGRVAGMLRKRYSSGAEVLQRVSSSSRAGI